MPARRRPRSASPNNNSSSNGAALSSSSPDIAGALSATMLIDASDDNVLALRIDKVITSAAEAGTTKKNNNGNNNNTASATTIIAKEIEKLVSKPTCIGLDGAPRGRRGLAEFLNARDLSGETALGYASHHFATNQSKKARDVALAIAEFLLSHGADITAAERRNGFTPLARACNMPATIDDTRLIARFLEEAPAQTVNVPCTGAGLTPLLLAAEAGNAAVCRFLVEEHEADPNVIGSVHRQRLIHCAALGGFLEVVEFAIEACELDNEDDEDEDEGDDEDDEDNDDDDSSRGKKKPTPKGKRPVAKKTNNKKQQTNNSKGKNSKAASSSSPLDNIRCARGGTPLHYAAEIRHNQRAANVINFLINQKKCNVDAVTLSGATPLLLAVEANAIGAVQILIQHGANAVLPAKDGALPVDQALRFGHMLVVQRLVAAGCVLAPPRPILSPRSAAAAAARGGGGAKKPPAKPRAAKGKNAAAPPANKRGKKAPAPPAKRRSHTAESIEDLMQEILEEDTNKTIRLTKRQITMMMTKEDHEAIAAAQAESDESSSSGEEDDEEEGDEDDDSSSASDDDDDSSYQSSDDSSVVKARRRRQQQETRKKNAAAKKPAAKAKKPRAVPKKKAAGAGVRGRPKKQQTVDEVDDSDDVEIVSD